MTENEARCAINNLKAMYQGSLDKDETYLLAIKALEEIQEFRKQGITIEKALDTMCDLAGAENLIEQYREIGTIEEFKALKEKSVAKKLRENDECIRCGNELWMLRDTGAKYCQYCGQKLDWQ